MHTVRAECLCQVIKTVGPNEVINESFLFQAILNSSTINWPTFGNRAQVRLKMKGIYFLFNNHHLEWYIYEFISLRKMAYYI